MAELVICGDGEVRLEGAVVGCIQWARPYAGFGIAGVYDIGCDQGCDCCIDEDEYAALKGDLEREALTRARAETLLKCAVEEINKLKAELALQTAGAAS